jgi:hypothetical protein
MRAAFSLPLVALLLGAACASDGNPSGPGRVPPPVELLQVVGVSAVIAESFPAQVTLDVTGQFPNVCTAVDGVTQTRSGNRVEVHIRTRSTSEICILIYPEPTLVRVPLQGGFAPGDYVVRVNGFETRFRID